MERSEQPLTLDEVVEGIVYGAQDLGIGIGTLQAYQALLEIAKGLENLYGFGPYAATGNPMTQFDMIAGLRLVRH